MKLALSIKAGFCGLQWDMANKFIFVFFIVMLVLAVLINGIQPSGETAVPLPFLP
jgi:hypothetical protein